MATVTVGCKLPHGLVARVDEKTVVFNGLNSSSVIGGHGLTPDVDQSFWIEWLKRNAGAAFVKNGFVFAQAKPADAIAQAKDNQSPATGLEPLKPEGDPRLGMDAPKPADQQGTQTIQAEA